MRLTAKILKQVRRVTSVRTAMLALFAVTLTTLVSIEPLVKAFPADFRSFYYAARAATQDVDIYDTEALHRIARQETPNPRIFPYLYPPPLAVLLRPLSGGDWLPALRSTGFTSFEE